MWEKNITGQSDGTYRSLNGAADENVFIGKATKAGFFLFFKAWRDMPYDAVLDHEGILFRVEVKGASADKGGKTQFNTPMPIRCGRVADTWQPFISGEISYTLNRQFRTWPLLMGWVGDTLVVRCKEAHYDIPRSMVEQADGFCWDSPQRDGASYVTDGTFAFISRRALETLQKEGKMIYDGITWREVSRSEHAITVRADIDRTEMTISLTHPLPLVLSMRHNPLGIDWNILFK